MANFTPKKIDTSTINSGQEYAIGDLVAPSAINSPIESGLYTEIIADGLTQAPDISQIAGGGTPTVEFVDGATVNGVKTKKFAFKNIASIVGATQNGLTISGQNASGTEVKKTFNGSAAVEMAFNNDNFNLTETNGVVTIYPVAKAGVVQYKKVEGSLPTTGWTDLDLNTKKYTISDSDIRVNSSVKMYLSDVANIVAYSKSNGKITITRRYVPNSPIPYKYEVEQTTTEGLFEIINSYVPTIPSAPTALPQQTGSIKSGILPTTGWTTIDYQGGTAKTLTINDTYITDFTDVLMELTDDGNVKAYSLENGKITIVRDSEPKRQITYEYKAKRTNSSGQFTLINHYMPNSFVGYSGNTQISVSRIATTTTFSVAVTNFVMTPKANDVTNLPLVVEASDTPYYYPCKFTAVSNGTATLQILSTIHI